MRKWEAKITAGRCGGGRKMTGESGVLGGRGAERGAGVELGQEQGFPEAPCPQQEGCPTVGTAHYSGQIVHFAHCPHSTPNDHLKPVLSPFAGGDTGPRTRPRPHSSQEAEPTGPRFNPKCSCVLCTETHCSREEQSFLARPFLTCGPVITTVPHMCDSSPSSSL